MFKALSKAKAKKGFTLVELIVVISIIAILMLILVPSLLAYLKKSKKTKAEANAKTCYNAVVAVFTDEYAKGNSLDGSSLVTLAKSNGMLDSAWVVTAELDSSSNISYVTWAANSSASSGDADDGDWARWPAA